MVEVLAMIMRAFFALRLALLANRAGGIGVDDGC